MMATEFTVEFRVREGNVNHYRTFISDLRQRLSAAGTSTILALLAPPPPSPPRFFDLILRTNDHFVPLRFRMDDLGYMMWKLFPIGYRMENGKWLEFDNKDHVHLIAEARTEFLDFDDSYALLGRVVDMSRDDIAIGSQSLANAIYNLATSEDGGARAQSLMTVIVMFADAIRLKDVQDFVARSYVGGARIQDADSCLDLMQQIRAWGQLPVGKYRMDACPRGWPVFHQWGIRQIVEVMGMASHYCFKKPPRLVRGMTTMPCEDHGLPLLEVFSVQIFNSNVYVGCQVYGMITVKDTLRTQYIYNCSRDNPDYISAGHYYVLLTGPSEPISAYGQFAIKFCLYDKARKDEVVINEEIDWNFYEVGNVYDKLISEQLSTGMGSLTINYAVFRSAVAAKLKLQKLQGGESKSKVYGRVSGSTSGDGETKTLLFQRGRADYVTIRYGDIIPFSRSVVAVPLSCATFTVTVKLFDVSSDQEVVDTTITFQPKLSGSDVKPIREDYFEGSMSVDWVRL